MSGIGKGLLSASIGRLLKSCGYTVTLTKIDPYVNVDAGTLSPFEHGEVFVLDDGGEVDLDFGHYERFTNVNMAKSHNITTGTVFEQVIANERKGDYLGKTIQIIPHVTGEIKKRLRENSEGVDISIVEVGGTVGDIEGGTFMEALRQFKEEEDLINVHLTFIPLLGIDQKTKPTQHSVIEMRRMGIVPDILVGRCEQELREKTKQKLSLFCSVEEEAVVSDPDLDNIYELPLALRKENIHRIIQKKLGLRVKEPKLKEWEKFVDAYHKGPEITVGIVGKYARGDTYLSIHEAISHAGVAAGVNPKVKWIDCEDVEDKPGLLRGTDCMITPGGFGTRGTEGKIKGIAYSRRNKLPWLGLCFGFQLAVVEFARSQLGLDEANSTELEPETPHPVIIPHWEAGHDVMGGTMRLGSMEVQLEKGTQIRKLYGQSNIHERHRHRYGLNPKYAKQLQAKGMEFTGACPEDKTIETLELPGQFFIGVQYHPEFLSRPTRPHPLFVGLLKAAKSAKLKSKA